MSIDASPFDVLGLAPTLDAGAIKRAYFAAVTRTPPHGDAEAFRRVREAYETLASADGRAASFLRSPAASLGPRLEALEARVAEAARAAAAKREETGRARTFAAWASETSLADAVRSCESLV
jgi:curved DNA-binding protein CbpA